MTTGLNNTALEDVLSHHLIELNSFEPLHITVMNKLRNLILEEKIPDGMALREETLAKQLGVSRGPIRDAVKQLATEGLVEIIPRRGAFVHWVSKEQLEELVLIRVGVEAASLRLAMIRNFKSLVENLELAVAMINENLSKSDWSGVLEAEVKFHDLIYEHSLSQRIETFWSQIRPQVVASIMNDRAFLSDPEDLLRSHQELLDVIATGNTDDAVLVLRDHIQPVSRLGKMEVSH